MSKLISIHTTRSVEREITTDSCEACGRMVEKAIKLTNLSAVPLQTYNACPFCFSKLNVDMVIEEPNDMKISAVEETRNVPGQSKENVDSSKQTDCPHYLGYLKKRPKNMPIPDDCLTCNKMIKCVL